MFKNIKPKNDNEGHDGTIWSRQVQVVSVLFITMILAIANIGPALAAGISSFGK